MIKFFRHIRRSLIQSSSGKYFLYAFGEIALVVIGILIALQINNWNEGNTKEKKLNTYLRALTVEINQNISNLELIERRALADIKTSLEVISIANSDSAQYFTSDDFEKLNIGPPRWTGLDQSVLDDMISSGVLEHMQDGQLKKNIFRINTLLELNKSNYNNVRDTWDDYLLPYHTKNVNIISFWDSISQFKVPETVFKNNIDAYIHNREFSNMVASRTRMMGNLQRSTTQTIGRFEGLISDIEQYLKDD